MAKRMAKNKVLMVLLAMAMLLGIYGTANADENDYMWFGTASNGFDIRGKSGDSYISTTFSGRGSGNGYYTMMQVGDNDIYNFSPFAFDKVYESDGVKAFVSASLNNNAVHVSYHIQNDGDSQKTIKIGSCGDTMIDASDNANVSFQSKDGKNGIKMDDGNYIFWILPGNDSDFTTRWSGKYSGNNNGSSYKDHVFDNGNNDIGTDSALAWSWTVTLRAGETTTKTAEFIVAKSLEITSSSVIADTKASTVALSVAYEDKSNLTQTLHYQIDSEAAVTDPTTSNTTSTTKGTFSRTLDVSNRNWENGSMHTVKLWLTNNDGSGKTSRELLYSFYWTKSSSTQTEYTLSFVSNSGKLFASLKGPSGTVVNLPEDELNGYIYKGWSKNEDRTGTIYSGTYTITQDETLYSTLLKKYKVTFNSQGGTNVSAIEDAESGSGIEKPNDPTRTGYSFDGWYKEAACTNAWQFKTTTETGEPVTGNTTLYAKWTPNTYTVTLDNQGATTAGAANVTATYSAVLPSIADNLPEKTGYTFGGYYSETNGGGTQYLKEDGTPTDATWTTAGEGTLYAKWTVQDAAVVATAPGAKTLTYNEAEQELVTAGTAVGGTMQYALGTDSTTGPTSEWSIAIPKGKEAGTYYIWFKAAGDATHTDSVPACVISTITSGGIDVEIIPKEGAPKTASSNLAVIANEETTAEERNRGVKFWLSNEPLSENQVPAASKNVLTAKLQELGYTAGTWFDLSLFKQVNGFSPVAIRQTKNAVLLSIGVPEELWKEGRTFSLLAEHDGLARKLDETTGHVLNGESKLFSTYLIAYKDPEPVQPTEAPAAAPTAAPTKVPRTGDGANLGLWIGLLLLGLLGIAVFTGAVKRKHRKQ